jgi:hypothetical protein
VFWAIIEISLSGGGEADEADAIYVIYTIFIDNKMKLENIIYIIYTT